MMLTFVCRNNGALNNFDHFWRKVDPKNILWNCIIQILLFKERVNDEWHKHDGDGWQELELLVVTKSLPCHACPALRSPQFLR